VAEVEIRLLGPVEALLDGTPVPLGGAKQRAALAVLALHAGRVVPAERLVDALWGDDPPPTAATALQGHISRLRRLLGADAIATARPGYVLRVPANRVDALRFEELRETDLEGALALWRGDALADVAAEPGLGDEARRLDELRATVTEQLMDEQLAAGRHAELVPRLEERVAADPLRERPVAQLVLALYRSGRPADALAAYGTYRARLRDTLGLDPSPELRELERSVIRQDPSLAPSVTEPPAVAPLRTPVTVVAAEVSSGSQDPEVYARELAEAREAARLVLERHGAMVQREGATVVVGSFGVPEPHEDDAARAVHAADELLALGARVGVASGEAFGGESPAAAEALRLVDVDGVNVDALTRARARPRRMRLDTPLAGRDAERDALRAAYRTSMQTSRSELVAVTGAAGIGKSRLVGELLREIGADAHIVLARCQSYGDGVSLIAAIDIVRGVAELPAGATASEAAAVFASLLAEDERVEPAVEQLLRVLGLAEDPPDEESMWAVRRLLDAAARRQPTVLVVDDLHWAAAPILELVRQLGDPADAPLFVVTTTREPPEGFPGALIPLQPLAPEACASIASSLLGSAVDAATLDTLVHQSGGNPLYLEELVLSLRAGEPSQPRSLESLLAARLARLPEDVRDTIGCAAVIGRSFSLEALVDLAGGPVGDVLERAAADSIFQPTPVEIDDLEFRHLLIRDAAYAALPLARRAELHERHADWWDRTHRVPPLEAEALAVYHLDQAYRARATLAPDDERLQADGAAIAARSAALGRILLARGDAAAAAALLGRARSLDPADDEIAVELGRAHLDVGDFGAAAAAFADASGPRAALGLLDVRLRIEPGADLTAAGEEVAAALPPLEAAGDDVGVIEALLVNAYLAVARGDAAQVTATLDRALEFARRAGRSRAETWIRFLLCGACWYGPLPVSDGLERCEAILAEGTGRPGVEASALQALAVLHALDGAFGKARRRVAESRALRRDVGQLVGAAASAIDEGIVELIAGDAAAAARVLREGTQELERLGEQGYYSTAAALLGEALVTLGELDEARTVAKAVADAAAGDDVVSQVGWRCVLARADRAEPLAREAVALADTTDFLILRAEAWSALAEVTGDTPARKTARAHLERKGAAPAAVDGWTRSLR